MHTAAPALCQPQQPVLGGILGYPSGPTLRPFNWNHENCQTTCKLKPRDQLFPLCREKTTPVYSRFAPGQPQCLELVVAGEHPFWQVCQKGVHTHIPGPNEDGDHIRLWLLRVFILHLLQKLAEPFSLLDREEQRQLARCLTPPTRPLEKPAEPGSAR